MHWFSWMKFRQTGRPEGELQFTIFLCKPHWDCDLQLNCYYCVPPGTFIDHSGCCWFVFLKQQLPSVPSCPVQPSLASLLLLIPIVVVQKCPKGRLKLSIRTHNSMLALPEARPGQSLLLLSSIIPSISLYLLIGGYFFLLNRKFIHLEVFLNCTGSV